LAEELAKEALAMATTGIAAVLGLPDDLGTIARGKLAVRALPKRYAVPVSDEEL
jgi:cytosine/adenosine deaminase-related metal-dependent hydrolase